jgi:AhpD family alkylhydroperoxidase
MTSRIEHSAAPGAYEALRTLSHYLDASALPAELRELVKLRVSMINGCAFCIDMHWAELVAHGEPVERLYGLLTWDERPEYTPRERAALAWAEAVTRLATTDALFAELREHFTERDAADLTFTIAQINAWNRICAAFRTVPATAK